MLKLYFTAEVVTGNLRISNQVLDFRGISQPNDHHIQCAQFETKWMLNMKIQIWIMVKFKICQNHCLIESDYTGTANLASSNFTVRWSFYRSIDLGRFNMQKDITYWKINQNSCTFEREKWGKFLGKIASVGNKILTFVPLTARRRHESHLSNGEEEKTTHGKKMRRRRKRNCTRNCQWKENIAKSKTE